MAFSNTYNVTNPGSGVSNREDLTDVLTILAPEETPVLSLANKSEYGLGANVFTKDLEEAMRAVDDDVLDVSERSRLHMLCTCCATCAQRAHGGRDVSSSDTPLSRVTGPAPGYLSATSITSSSLRVGQVQRLHTLHIHVVLSVPLRPWFLAVTHSQMTSPAQEPVIWP